MEPTEHLENKGIIRSGPRVEGNEHTIIVLGIGRGGTSLCSRSLHELGVFTGKDSLSPIFEDRPLSKSLENRDFKSVKELISEYNRKHNIWAFKRPTTNGTISELHSLLRNPRYVVVFRDILAIGQRNFLSMHDDPFDSMHGAIDGYKTILDFLKEYDPPAMLISYEKAVSHPKYFIQQLIDFSGLKARTDPDRVSTAISSITPSPKDYLINTSAVDYFGYLDAADSDHISGWASFDKTNRSVELELFINEEKVQEFVPTNFREDILEKGLHPTGKCGYHFNYPNQIRPESGDKISVRFKETGVELRNSPKTI